MLETVYFIHDVSGLTALSSPHFMHRYFSVSLSRFWQQLGLYLGLFENLNCLPHNF